MYLSPDLFKRKNPAKILQAKLLLARVKGLHIDVQQSWRFRGFYHSELKNVAGQLSQRDRVDLFQLRLLHPQELFAFLTKETIFEHLNTLVEIPLISELVINKFPESLSRIANLDADIALGYLKEDYERLVPYSRTAKTDTLRLVLRDLLISHSRGNKEEILWLINQTEQLYSVITALIPEILVLTVPGIGEFELIEKDKFFNPHKPDKLNNLLNAFKEDKLTFGTRQSVRIPFNIRRS